MKAEQSKGLRTKQTILESANRVFNKEKKLLTLEELASQMQLPKSRITNHFPRKELLLLGIYKQYEERLRSLVKMHAEDQTAKDMVALIYFYSQLMDLMYEFRFSIAYLFVNPLKDERLGRHLQETYKENKHRIRMRLVQFIRSGLIVKGILEHHTFNVFLFKYTNLMTTWMISLKLYDSDRGYTKVKPVYLEGILTCFEPFLTESGRRSYHDGIKILRSAGFQ